MLVLMVDIRVMRVLVRQSLVDVGMAVGVGAMPRGLMHMLMVFIVLMAVGVLKWLVGVRVFVLLGQVQPDTQPHQRTGQPEGGRSALTQQGHCHCCPHERRG